MHGDGGVCVKFCFKASRFCSSIVLNQPLKILTKERSTVEIERSLLGYLLKAIDEFKKIKMRETGYGNYTERKLILILIDNGMTNRYYASQLRI